MIISLSEESLILFDGCLEFGWIFEWIFDIFDDISTIWVCLKMLCTPLYPMVLLIIIPTKWLFHWGYTPFSDIPI